jgi:hypothetical protein
MRVEARFEEAPLDFRAISVSQMDKHLQLGQKGSISFVVHKMLVGKSQNHAEEKATRPFLKR